jgi:hypothetical protein
MGYLKEENYTSEMQRCLTVKVNKRDYDVAYALTSTPLSKMGLEGHEEMPVFEAYKLGDLDCMGFLINVAEVLRPKGLNVPERGKTETPLKYIERFIECQPSSACSSSDGAPPAAPTNLSLE